MSVELAIRCLQRGKRGETIMGYCYDHRGRLCCDVCGTAGKVRKVPCPVRYCSAVAACPECRAVGKHKPADDHEHCREIQAEYAADLAAFRAGGLHLVVEHDASEDMGPASRCYVVSEWKWYSAYTDHFGRTWFAAAQLSELTAMGHTYEVKER